MESYEWWLRRFIAEHGQVLPLPTRTHDDLLDALFHARKPFSAGEKGYKDALIWWTLVEALDGDSWVFGTDNSKDFLSHDLATLAADLVEDVRSLSLDPSQIGVRTSLDEIVAELVPSDVAVEDQFLAIARSSEGSEHIASLIQEQRFPLDDPSGLMPRWPKWIETTGEMDDPEFGQAEARPVEGGFLVRALVTATSHVAGGLEEDLSPDPGPDWGTWDDWGVGVTYAYERPQRVTYEMTFKFTPPAEVSEVQVESVVLNAPWLAAGHPRPRP